MTHFAGSGLIWKIISIKVLMHTHSFKLTFKMSRFSLVKAVFCSGSALVSAKPTSSNKLTDGM